MKKGHWTPEEQRKHIGSAMAIATTARLLLGLRRTDAGKEYIAWMVTQEGMDEELCKTAGTHILIYELPFAVELCLKGLRSLGAGEFLWTHNLQLLWNDLGEAERIDIRKRVEDRARGSEEKAQRRALGITGAPRTVDQVVGAHQNDFEDWRYVTVGEMNLTEKKARTRIDEAMMDLYGILCACVDHHKSRCAESR